MATREFMLTQIAWMQRMAAETDDPKIKAQLSNQIAHAQSNLNTMARETDYSSIGSSAGITLTGYVALSSDIIQKPTSIGGFLSNYKITMFKPFFDVNPTGRYRVSSDLQHLDVINPDGSIMTSLSTDSNATITVYKPAKFTVAGWYTFPGVTFKYQSKPNPKTGVLDVNPATGQPYLNITCRGIQEWTDGPKAAAMHSYCSEMYSGATFVPQPLPESWYPLEEAIEATLPEAKEIEKKMSKQRSDKKTAASAASSSSSDGTVAESDDDKFSEKYTSLTRSLAATLLIRRYLRTIDPKEDPKNLRGFVSGNRQIIYSMNGASVESSTDIETGCLTTIMRHLPDWPLDILKKSDGETKVIQPSVTYPFGVQLNLSGCQTIIRCDSKPSGDIEETRMIINFKIGGAARILEAFGIANPLTASKILPKYLPTAPITFVGPLDAGASAMMDINQNPAVNPDGSREHGLVFTTFKVVLDIFSFLENNAQRVTADFAVNAWKAFYAREEKRIKALRIATNEAVRQQRSVELPNSSLFENLIKSVPDDKLAATTLPYCRDNNILHKITKDRAFNVCETPCDAVDKGVTGEFWFYCLHNGKAIKDLQPYFDIVKEHRALISTPGYDRAVQEKLLQQIDAYAQKFSGEFNHIISTETASESFDIPSVIDGDFTFVVYAVLKSVDDNPTNIFDATKLKSKIEETVRRRSSVKQSQESTELNGDSSVTVSSGSTFSSSSSSTHRPLDKRVVVDFEEKPVPIPALVQEEEDFVDPYEMPEDVEPTFVHPEMPDDTKPTTPVVPTTKTRVTKRQQANKAK